MAVSITAPTSQVVNRSGGVSIAWDATYPQVAYEILYRRKGASAWSTFGRVESTSKQVALDTTQLNDFEEYHFRVIVYTDTQMDEANKYVGSDSSPAYSIILVPNQVSVMKLQGAEGSMIEVPIYPTTEDVGAPHVGVGNKGNVPLVSVDDPLATKARARVNGETLAMAGATAKTEPTGVANETDIDVTVTQYAYTTQAHNYYYAYTSYYYYLNSVGQTAYKPYYTAGTGSNYGTYTTGPFYNRGTTYHSGTYYPSYSYTSYPAYYSTYTYYYYTSGTKYTSGTYYPKTSYTYYPAYYRYYTTYTTAYYVYYYGKTGYYSYGAYYYYTAHPLEEIWTDDHGYQYISGYRYNTLSGQLSFYRRYASYTTYTPGYGSYAKPSYGSYVAGYYSKTGYKYYAKTYYYSTTYYYRSSGSRYYIAGYYSSTRYAYYSRTYYYASYYYYPSYGSAYYISSYYRYYGYGGYTSYYYTAYNYALDSQTKYSGYTTYTYYRYVPGYYQYKITA